MSAPADRERGRETTRETSPLPSAISSSSRAAGLCPQCRHVKVIESERGSMFYLCRLSASNPRYDRYPRQPVVFCAGHEKVVSEP